MKKYLRLLPKRGFTLIELLVVMGIIALLTAVVMFSVSEVRAQSRDKQRMVSLKQLELALELYREANGSYPATGCGVNQWQWASPGPGTAGWYNECEEYIVGLAPTYIPKLPTDPKNEDINNGGFAYRTNGNEYKVIVNATVESLLITDREDEFARCPSSCTDEAWCELTPISRQQTYAIYADNNPGDDAGGECY